MYAIVMLFRKKTVIQRVNESGIHCTGIEPFHFRKWHNKTALFTIKDDQGNSYFLKASRRIRTIIRETESINLIQANQERIPLKVIDILCEYHTEKWGFFVQPFVAGTTLEELIEKKELSEEKSYELIDTLEQSVAEFQRLSFVCADMTPKNIIIDANGEVYLIDFEFAHLPNSESMPIQIRPHQIKYIGGKFGLGIGLADDGYSLLCIARKLIPDLLSRDYELWLRLNKGIGICQCDLYNDRLHDSDTEYNV